MVHKINFDSSRQGLLNSVGAAPLKEATTAKHFTRTHELTGGFQGCLESSNTLPCELTD